MPRASAKKPKAKGPKLPDAPDQANGNQDGAAASDVAVAEPPPEPAAQELVKRELPQPVQQPQNKEQNRSEGKSTAEDKDKIAATSLNIAKLQAMSMTELNQMARDL